MKKLAILALAAAGLFLALPGAASAHEHWAPARHVWFPPRPHFHAPFFPLPIPVPAFYGPRYYAPAPVYAAPYPPPAAYAPGFPAPHVYFHVPGVTFQIGGNASGLHCMARS